MHEQRECYKCDGRGTAEFGSTCSSCGGRGWKIQNISENDSYEPEPLFYGFFVTCGVVLGLIAGGYFGWCVGGIGGALTYGIIGAIALTIIAALFSMLLRLMIKICIGIGIIFAINFLWGKGNNGNTGSSQSTSVSTQR